MRGKIEALLLNSMRSKTSELVTSHHAPNFWTLRHQSCTQSPRSFWLAGERPERLWDSQKTCGSSLQIRMEINDCLIMAG